MYSSDVIWGKIALDAMPLYMFYIILSLLYFILGIGLYFYHRKNVHNYVYDENNRRYIY